MPSSHDCAGYYVDDGCDDEEGAIDMYGDGCYYYDAVPEHCGAYDDAYFIASQSCCTCGGGETNICQDIPYVFDLYGDGCEWYTYNPNTCGDYDDEDFKANQVCCGCGGGVSELNC